MPTFLAKVFSRGREKEKEKGKDGLKEASSPTSKQAKRNSRASAQSLLEGRFEAVSPSVSPSAEKYEGKDQTPKKDKEKEKGGLFRPRSRTGSAGDASRKQEEFPQLKLDLNLPSAEDGSKKRNLSIVYEGDALLDEAVLGEKRLKPAEALKLMRACLSVLSSRGLDTLGIMHPHWHSASPAAQRKIISLFLASLSASSEASASASFDSELEFARSPHDVAAVFRWALRHLKLEGDTFDKGNTTSLAWYDTFVEKEKAAEYPKTAYSDILLPAVKPSHGELLDSTLSLVSRLASHSEWNGTSGSKLSLLFGHYLLTGNRVDNLEDWIQFYSQWERAGRALEHIFLASLRDEEAKTGIPKRLSELVANYPYAKSASDNRFPRPTRFATRAYDGLYVRVTAEAPSRKQSREEVYLPVQIVETALKSDIADGSEDKDIVALWEEIRKLSIASDEERGTEGKVAEKSLTNIISDDSIRILSLKSDGLDKETPMISTFPPVPEHESLFGTPTANGRAKATNGSTSVSRQTSEATTSSPSTADWNVFSSAGFGESSAGQSLAATLLDSDLEKTEPKLATRRSLKKGRSPGRASHVDRAAEHPSSPTDAPIRFKTSRVSLVKIDEAFIDFWSDALLDPISDIWPNFVVVQLKSDAVRTHGDKKVAWLVIEQKFVTPAPPAPPSPPRRTGSPRPSARSAESRTSAPGIASRVSTTFSPRKRFNFFGTSQAPKSPTLSGAEKRESKLVGKGTEVNELGEVISENAAPAPPPKAEEAKAVESKPEPIPEKPKEDTKETEEVATGVTAVAVGAGVLPVAPEAAAEAVAPEVPAKEAEPKSEPAVPPVPEKPVAEEPPAAPVAEHAEPPAAEPVSTEPGPTHDEVEAKVERPAAPETPPANAEPAAAEEPTQPSIVAEENVADASQGTAPDSKFVEHIENTPPKEEPTTLEPVTEQGEVEQPEANAEEPPAPESVPEATVATDEEEPRPASEAPKPGPTGETAEPHEPSQADVTQPVEDKDE